MIIFILCVLASFTVARAAVWLTQNGYILWEIISGKAFKVPKEFK